jgi:hypothetical protein
MKAKPTQPKENDLPKQESRPNHLPNAISTYSKIYTIGLTIGQIQAHTEEFIQIHPEAQPIVLEISNYITRIQSVLVPNPNDIQSAYFGGVAPIFNPLVFDFGFSRLSSPFGHSGSGPNPLYKIGEIMGSLKAWLSNLAEAQKEYTPFITTISQLFDTLTEYISLL